MALRGRPRRIGVEREPSGRISRKQSSTKLNFYTVYVAACPTAGLVKVGRSVDAEKRRSQLASTVGGQVIICAQFKYKTLEESVSAEKDIIQMMIDRGYERNKKEWFKTPFKDLPQLVMAFGSSTRAFAVDSLGQFGGYDGRRSTDLYWLKYGHRAKVPVDVIPSVWYE